MLVQINSETEFISAINGPSTYSDVVEECFYDEQRGNIISTSMCEKDC